MLTGGLNWALAHAINSLAGHNAFLDRLMIFSANDLVFLIVLGAAVWWFLPSIADAGKQTALAAALALVAGLAAAVVIGHFFYVPRPFVAHSVTLLVHHGPDASFPSDHVTGAFGVAGTALIRRAPGWVLFLLAATLIGFARVYVGVHYPADVLGGAVIGLALAVGIQALDPVLAHPYRLAIGLGRRLGVGA